jgi:hypothetical protein
VFEENHVEVIASGFYGSGESLIVQLLSGAGVFMGHDQNDALSSSPFFEHPYDPDVVQIHRGILSDNGVDVAMDVTMPLYIRDPRWEELSRFVSQRQSRHAHWGFADPTSCLFLGVWRYLLPGARFIIAYRDPADCLRSLRSPDRGIGVDTWDTYNRYLVAFARAHVADCLVLPFECLSAGYPLIAAVNRRFGANLPERSISAGSDVADPLQPRSSPEYAAPMAKRVAELWHSLDELAGMTADD